VRSDLSIDSYGQLRAALANVLDQGKKQAQEAIERVRVETYSRAGHLIHQHILTHKDRADYGDQVIARLSGDVGISGRRLYQMLQLYRSFKIVNARSQLGWTHYRVLMRLQTPEERKYYEKRAIREGWTTRELQTQVDADPFSKAPALVQDAESVQRPRSFKALRTLRGRLYTYRIVASPGGGGLRIDLGFAIHPRLSDEAVKRGRLKAGDMVESIRPDPGSRYSSQPAGRRATRAHGMLPSDGQDRFRFRKATDRKASFYTYRARITRIVDGDTLWLDVDCGFEIYSPQKVRLRGIDTPELDTSEGKRARTFVVKALSEVDFIGITTTKPDKYGRYLADVFYLPGCEDADRVVREGRFLNRDLIEAGLATRM
jgi:endonuclease YncB( thermonuclease family)